MQDVHKLFTLNAFIIFQIRTSVALTKKKSNVNIMNKCQHIFIFEGFRHNGRCHVNNNIFYMGYHGAELLFGAF